MREENISMRHRHTFSNIIKWKMIFCCFWWNERTKKKSLCFNAVSVVSYDMFYIIFSVCWPNFPDTMLRCSFFYVKMKICCVMFLEWNDETCAFIGILLSRTVTMKGKLEVCCWSKNLNSMIPSNTSSSLEYTWWLWVEKNWNLNC